MKILKKLSLRYQLMLWNTFLILFALITTGWAINSLVKNTVEKNMVKDLTASVVSIQKMIDTTVNASIHNYLRGIGEKNVDMLDQLHKEAAAGKMDLAEAKEMGEKILLNQPIGKTGYIYALTSDATLAVHPVEGMKNRNVSEYELSQKQILEKKGYVAYTWKNPGEDKEREKVLYMAYFEPWDWIVSVSSYREEFIALFDIRDIQAAILSFQFGQSGSSFIMDGEGNFLVHRQLTGNLSLLKDSESWAALLAEMKRAGTGTIRMEWHEKQGEAPRERLFFSHHIPSLDWFVVSSVYSDEIRQQLNRIHQIILAAILMILLILLPFSLYLGRSITRPLVRLAREMEQADSGVFDIRAEETASGEIGRLAAHFNAYMARLKTVHHELNREIEERIKAAAQLNIFKKVFENALEGISITDADGHILDVNQAFTDITGYSREEAAGQNPRILKSNRHDDAFYKEMWDQLKTRGYWAGEIWNRRKNGEAYPEILSINSIKQDDGEISHYVAVFHDISEMKLQQEKIQHQAYHDELTGLPNRYLVRDRLSMALKAARRQHTMVAVIFLDMDNFKFFNDSLGHASGDVLLQTLGDRLRKIIREQDTVARLGGDEFLVIAGDIKFQKEVLELADRLFEAMKAPFVIDGHELLISLSVGITLYPEDGADADLLMKNADMAMYQSKISGKNRYHMFTPELNRLALYKMEMVKEFRTALTQKEFRVYYQPKVDPATNCVLGLEALVRWQKQDGAPVSPGEFIPMAEETGLILQLSRYVLEEACKGLKILKERFAFPLTLSVNISPLEFKQPDFADNILKVVSSHLLAASSIEIEITETTMITDLKSTVEKLNVLKTEGVSIAIDDFGTGYSSLYYLKKLPISTLKIDKSFIDDMTTDQNDANIVETIILMAKNLGIEVVAEGVETKEQFELLAKYKCDLIQGYYYAKPMPLKDLILYLEDMS
ncbi:MAG: EAL domain-containing protein [Desulfobacula sp.]|nr:EAL domain-containing protein [Desulfobacula sp.]